MARGDAATGARAMSRRSSSFSGQFAGRLVEMLESYAYRTLSLSAMRLITRVEIEFAHHGGQDNGRLPVTFDDFEQYGIHRHAIAPAMREAEALGFIEVTVTGLVVLPTALGEPSTAIWTSPEFTYEGAEGCLLYTSDAADE